MSSSDPDRVNNDATSAALVPNIPIPDELNAVREQIKALELREAELRRLLIVNPDLREGAAWLAEVREVIKQQLDRRELTLCHPKIVEQFTHSVTETRVTLSGITEDGEIVSARKMRALLR